MDAFWAWFIGAWVCVGVSLIAWSLWHTPHTPDGDRAGAASLPMAAPDDDFAAWFYERSQATGMDYTREQAYRMYQAWCKRSSVELAQGEQLL